MRKINVHEAKTHFSSLISDVQNGEEILVAKAGKPVAKIVPLEQPAARQLGWAKHLDVHLSDEFDEENLDVIRDFYDGSVEPIA